MAFSPETYAVIKGKGGQANGFATLNGSGKIPESQLPSYVDDVQEGYYYNGAFYEDAQHTTEITGETGKIYADLNTGYIYRWSGSEYVQVGGVEYTAGNGIVISNGVIALPQKFYDYLDEITFEKPTIATLTPGWPSGNVEIGNSVSLGGITHKETNISNIQGTLKLSLDGSVIISSVSASATNAEIDLFPDIPVTRSSPGTASLMLSGIDTHGNTFSKTASKSFYAPKFSGYNAAASVSAADILAMTRQETFVTSFTLSADAYIYWTTTGTITKVTSGGFDVPMEAPVTVSLTINGLTVSYKCYRTSGKLLAGTHSFTIS